MSGNHSPLFIVGCGRSGTTMLRLMMDSHPDLAVPNESHFIPSFWFVRRRYIQNGILDALRLAEDIMRTRHFQLWNIPAEAVQERIRALPSSSFADVIDAIFFTYAGQHGKKRWGDKTPKYVKFIGLLAELFPTSRFVHLIRDGRNVALSYLSMPWGPANIWEAACKWQRDVKKGRNAGQLLGSGRYMELRYEHLVVKPREALEKICEFSELPFVERLLEYHDDGAVRLQWPDGMKYHAASTRPPTSDLRNWRTQLSSENILAFETVAGDLLMELGYERNFTSVPTSKLFWAKLKSQAFQLSISGQEIRRALRRRFTNRPVGGIRTD
jgi:hypothetical protein